MCPVYDIIYSFSLVVDGQIFGIVAPESHSRHDVHSIDFSPIEHYRCHVGYREFVEIAFCRTVERAGGCLREVVAFT